MDKLTQGFSIARLILEIGSMVFKAAMDSDDPDQLRLADIPGWRDIGIDKLKKDEVDFSGIMDYFDKLKGQ